MFVSSQQQHQQQLLPSKSNQNHRSASRTEARRKYGRRLVNSSSKYSAVHKYRTGTNTPPIPSPAAHCSLGLGALRLLFEPPSGYDIPVKYIKNTRWKLRPLP
ncbi:unnamed protein product, partial [Laminaria digitata]